MPRNMITRTITATKAEYMVANTETGTCYTAESIISGTYKDDSALLRALKKSVETESEKVLKVVSSSAVETLYGMSENDFIAGAHVLPPRKEYNKSTPTL